MKLNIIVLGQIFYLLKKKTQQEIHSTVCGLVKIPQFVPDKSIFLSI